MVPFFCPPSWRPSNQKTHRRGSGWRCRSWEVFDGLPMVSFSDQPHGISHMLLSGAQSCGGFFGQSLHHSWHRQSHKWYVARTHWHWVSRGIYIHNLEPFDPPLLSGFRRWSSAWRSHETIAVLQHDVIESSWLLPSPSSRMAAAARCEVAKIKESQFRCVPRKREKWLKVFTVFLFTVCTECCTYSIYLVWSISPSSGSMSFFVEVVVWLDLGPTLQVLRRPRGGCCRSAWSSRPLAGARSVGIRWMSSDSGSRVAAAARCEVAKIKESQFQYVPRKREKWLKVFVFFFGPLCNYSVGTCGYHTVLVSFGTFLPV